MDILNDILIMLISGVSHEHLVSMGVVIILTTTLLFVDTIQRIVAEVLRYNKDNHRHNNPITLLTTLTWYGWGKGQYVDEATGERRRYLMSERLRGDLLFSYAFMLIPFFAVCWSIIENLREMVEDDLIDIGKIFQYTIEIIKAWRGNG